MMTNAKTLIASSLVGLTMLGLPWALAEADHVKIDISVSQPSPEGVEAARPAGTTYVVPALVSQTFQAKEIQAHEVRAQTIYANRIEADNIEGTIHQTKEIKIGASNGDIKAPEISASVIYADEISANRVVAGHIYVRDIRRR